MIQECNNQSSCHDPKIITDGDTAQRVVCQHCWHQYTLRKDPFKGVPENRQYAKIFKKDVLQGRDPLFYKYYQQHLAT